MPKRVSNIFSPGLACTCRTEVGGTDMMPWTSPERSALTRAAPSGMPKNSISSRYGLPGCQYSSLRTAIERMPGENSLHL